MSVNSNLHFSRFAHCLHRDGVVAIFHALKLKPVFLSENSFLRFESWLNQIAAGVTPVIPTDIYEIVQALLDNRSLVHSPDQDDEVIKAFRERIPPPNIEIAYFILSERCNLNCDYCFIRRDWTSMRPAEDMTLEIAYAGLNMFSRLIDIDKTSWNNEKSIILYGGEPLLNKHVAIWIAEEISRRKSAGVLPEKTFVSLVTNGTLLDRTTARRLAEAGVSISISIDGDERATTVHRLRPSGEGAYEDILSGIAACRAEGIEPSFSVTLTPENLRDDLLRFLRVTLHSRSVGFNMLLTDSCFSVPDWYAESAADFLITAFREFRKHGVYEDRMMRKVTSFCKGEVYYFDCGACGGNQIVVAPDGQIGLCHGYLGSREFFVTDVHDLSFEPAHCSAYLEWNGRTPLNIAACQKCMSLGACGGGCPLNAQRNHGSIWDIDDRFCVHARKTIEWMIWELYESASKDTYSR